MKKLCAKLREKMLKNSLFIKIVAVVISAVICVLVFTAVVTIQAAQYAYARTVAMSVGQITDQIEASLSDFGDEVRATLNTMRTSYAVRHYLEDEDTASANAAYWAYVMDNQIDGLLEGYGWNQVTLAIVGTSGRTFVSDDGLITHSPDELLAADYSVESVSRRDTMSVYYLDEGFISACAGDSCIVCVMPLIAQDSTEPYGFAYILIPQNILHAFFTQLSNTYNQLLIIGQDGRIISSDDPEQTEPYSEALRRLAVRAESSESGYIQQRYNGRQVALISRPVPSLGLHVVGLIDNEALAEQVNEFGPVIVIAVLFTVLVIIAVFLVTRRTTKPLHNLVEEMGRVPSGDFSGKLRVEGSYEVRELTAAFNYMLDGLNRYVGQLIQLERDKRTTEIHALQMQINPHFIYNTLTSIKWLIWQNQRDQAVETIDAFSLLLRNTISNKKEMIPVEEEVENLRRYVLLQHIRFGEQIRVEITMTPGCSGCMIPKLLLQPFLENSFFHAFPDRADGWIHVFIDRRGNELVSEVIDNGVGMDPQNIRKQLDGKSGGEHFTGIGIENVNNRIHLLFGTGYGVRISSEPNKGTDVTVTIPVLHAEDLPESDSGTNA